jgi:flagellar assembly protein FliH
LSNLIKSNHVISLEDLKKLEQLRKISQPPQNNSSSDGDSEGNEAVDVETQTMKERILRDAEQTAEQIVRQAQITAQQLREAAEAEIANWWQAKREEDERAREEARQAGYDYGYAASVEQAGADTMRHWESRLMEAESIVAQAYDAKNATIAEAETFVVDLSCAIAEKIVSKRLAKSPEMAVRMFAQALARRKEKGAITLCVSPAQFSFVQASKDELALSIDSQAELQIVPDPTVKDGGCIVRSAFGSIDARIDTQLAAIRQELLRVAAHAAEEGRADAAP